MSEPSKTRTSFYRRLYVAHLISQGTDTVPAIMAATGMPRRTAQDTLSAPGGARHLLRLRADRGARHLQGHYRISDWGPSILTGSRPSCPSSSRPWVYP